MSSNKAKAKENLFYMNKLENIIKYFCQKKCGEHYNECPNPKDNCEYVQWLKDYIIHDKAKWNHYGDESWLRDDGSSVFMVCSNCNEVVLNNGSSNWDYCPNCGKSMIFMNTYKRRNNNDK